MSENKERHAAFIPLASVVVAYNNFPDSSILPTQEYLARILQDENVDEDTTHLAFYLMTLLKQGLISLDRPVLSRAIERVTVKYPEGLPSEHWVHDFLPLIAA